MEKWKKDIKIIKSLIKEKRVIDNNILTICNVNNIFHNIQFASFKQKISPNYRKLTKAVIILLKNIKDEHLEKALLDLIKSDFEFETICISNAKAGKEILGYTYKCTNPKTSKYLIDLAQKLQAKENNKALL